VTGVLSRLLAWGTAAATAVMAVGAVLWWTPWQAAAVPVIITSGAMFAALPVGGLVLLAVAWSRRRDLLYAVLTVLVTAIVVADFLVGGAG
jgi:hypothetical protein